MESTEAHIRLEKTALQISMYGGVFFVLLEFIMALVTHSQAVLMDSAYDGAESLMIIISLRIVPLLYKPTTEKRPFGYSQIESIFLVIKGFMLIAITVGLVANDIQIMLSGGRNVSFTLVGYFELFAAVVSAIVLLLLHRVNRRIDSPMVDAEMMGWQIDAAASVGMAAAFLLPSFIHHELVEAISPYLDQVAAIVLSLFILPRPLKTVATGLRDLFLLAPEQETIDQIKEISQGILDGYELTGEVYEVVRTGRRIWVSIYFSAPYDLISIANITMIQREIWEALRREFQDLYVELLPDVEEPYEEFREV